MPSHETDETRRSDDAGTVGSQSDLANLSDDELRQLLKEQGVARVPELDKEQLVEEASKTLWWQHRTRGTSTGTPADADDHVEQ